MMKLTLIQDQAIQALVAGAVGAEAFDRVFAGIRFDEIESTMLYAFARNEDVASDIEDSYSPLIATVASRVLNKQVDVVVVMPKVLQ
jgi:chromosomal replication initiation ATPase DnaA